MAVPSPCSTPGAVFHTSVDERGLSVSVDFGRVIGLTEQQAQALEANVHNALELALAPLFAARARE